MSFDNFVSCLDQDVQMTEHAVGKMVEFGKKYGLEALGAFKAIETMWKGLPPKVKQFVLRAALIALEDVAAALAAVLAAVGVVAVEALALVMEIAAVVGFAVIIVAVGSCALQA
jgi:predicted tellurium resistance membrane protein TerC